MLTKSSESRDIYKVVRSSRYSRKHSTFRDECEKRKAGTPNSPSQASTSATRSFIPFHLHAPTRWVGCDHWHLRANSEVHSKCGVHVLRHSVQHWTGCFGTGVLQARMWHLTLRVLSRSSRDDAFIMLDQQHDAAWKRIQQNTFTRWVRQKLETVDVTVSSLETDFEEGLKLIRLVEVLSGKSFGRHNKKVIFRHQKLENISLALQFLENEEHIKLVNIDSSAIADHNLKLILGLIWTLILHYSISKQVWGNHLNDGSESAEMSAREKLLTWLKAKLPAELSVTNFTLDWNDGIRLGALVDSCAPDLEVGWRKWLPSQALQSTFTAMQLASNYLGIAALIEPEELISPAVDEKSVMTYLSQFPGAKYTPSLGRFHDVVLAPVVGVSTKFTLQTRDAMVVPEVTIRGPDESSIRYIQCQLSKTIYEFEYQPKAIGEHEIMTTVRDNVSGDSVQLSRIKVMAVEGTDISSILVDGISNEVVIVGQRSDIVIDIGNLTPMKSGLEVFVEVDDGSKYLIPLENSSWTAEKVGQTKVCVFFDENVVREYKLIVRHDGDAARCRAAGEGLKRAFVDAPANFLVDAKDAGYGKVEVAIRGPSEVKTNVMDDLNGFYTVVYVPQTPGLYEILVYYGDKEKQIPVDYKRDPSKILIAEYSDGIALAGMPNSLIVDATRTALEPVSAHISNSFQQPIVEEISSRVYQVTFVPNAATNETIALELLYGNELLGKPMVFVVKHEEELKSLVLRNRSGGFPPSVVRASLPFEAVINVADVEKINELVAEIRGPDHNLRKSLLDGNHDNGIYVLNFIPDMAGKYIISIYVNGKLFSDPYNLAAVPVGLADKCFVECEIVLADSFDKLCTVGEPKVFVVNAKNGGEGALSIRSDKNDLETKIEQNKDGFYTVTVTARSEGQYRIVLMYGGIDIPGGTFDFECVPPPMTEEKEIFERTVEFRNNEHLVPRSFLFSMASEYQFSKLAAFVKMPSGMDDKAYIKDNSDGSVTVTYYPKECGDHLLSILHGGINMSGSPIPFYVNKTAEEYATVYGPGLLQAVVGEPAVFTICAKDSPTKELSVAIEGAAKATINCHDNKDGTCSVAWIPPVPGKYKIHVKLSGKPLKNSPFIVFAVDECQKQAHLSIQSTAMSEISLSIDCNEIEDLAVSARSPNGIEEPCFLRQISSSNLENLNHPNESQSLQRQGYSVGNLFGIFLLDKVPSFQIFAIRLGIPDFEAGFGIRRRISFSPHEVGEHLITVKRNDQVVRKSPFQVKTGNSSKVIVSGMGKENAICQKDNIVIVNMRKAGYGSLSLFIQGPSKAELRCIENKGGLASIVYKPTEPGLYILSVKFAGVHVDGSPFTINCTEKEMGIIKESANKKVKQAPVVLPGQYAALYLQLENVLPMEATAKVVGPNGYCGDVEIQDFGDNLYRIEFKPAVNGLYAISVFYKGQHVLGSPFQFTVGYMREVGAHRVRAAGVGLERAEVNKKKSFNLYTREAGQGELEVTVEGPSKAELKFHEHEDGNCHFDYKITEPGEYLISVKFNAEDIPDSPFKVFVAPAAGKAHRLELVSITDSGIPDKMCAFTLNSHGALGHLEAKLHTPSNRIETVYFIPINGSDLNTVQFVPSETGDYYVHVTLDGVPIYNSPFCFRIGTSLDNDPSVITVFGHGIYSGETGQNSEFMINTCNAGTGFLQIWVDGPSKVTLNAYEIRYMALAPGAYYVTIKYSGIHVPGSPFKVAVEGKKLGGGKREISSIKIDACAKIKEEVTQQIPVFSGDAKKVVVKGPGLNKFFPGRLAVFSIDTALAGDNVLCVGLLTSRGPCEEITLRHLGNGQYIVQYLVQEEVKGNIFIKYGDADVPGSPFAISF
uniref:Calponin-homology (CH) domain-containing protein n=1 Tax=Setaria digitata TaxID=48799 RepID=A0A915PPA4_9BILA